MIKLQHAKRELNIQNKQNRQQKWIKHIIQSNKKKKRPERNDSTLGLGAGRGTKLGDHMHARISKSEGNKESPKNTREREMGNYIHSYVHYTVCKMAGAQY